ADPHARPAVGAVRDAPAQHGAPHRREGPYAAAQRLPRVGDDHALVVVHRLRDADHGAVAQVMDDDEVMFITDAGQALRCRVRTISTMGRAVQGVRLMDLSPDEKIVSIARLAERDVGEPNGGPGEAAEGAPSALAPPADAG